MDSFSISYDFIEKYVRFSKPEYTQFYLYLKYRVHKNQAFPSIEEIALELDISPEHASFILDFWASRGELIHDSRGWHFPKDEGKTPVSTPKSLPQHQGRKSTRPSYTMAEIDAVASKNKAISGLFYQAETVLNKVLTQADMELLYSFVDWLGLPVEVITMLLSYAAKRGKTGRRYLETVAIDWADRGIDTFESAEAYVMELEERDSIEHKICSILGIYDRALTTTEKKYIKQWAEDTTISKELIPLAYDRTIANTGKLSWSYMNKILQSWAADGITTTADVEEKDNQFERKTTSNNTNTKKSKFNNYDDTNSVDYAKLEEQLLDMMLDN